MALMFHEIEFTHDGAATPLFTGVSAHFAEGWSGIVGANGTGKTTLLLIASGEYTVSYGKVTASGMVLYCPQRTDEQPELLSHFLTAPDGMARQWQGRLQIGDDWASRWSTLSHGERKRAQIAVALWQEPDILLIDEPTNHIDQQAQKLLQNALRAYRGVGVLVSHDRALLDDLCYQCLFLDPPTAIMRPGGYSQGAQQATLEEDSLREDRRIAKQSVARLAEEERRRRDEASRANRMRSKRNLELRDHDARGKIDLARVSGKDGQAGRLARQMQGRVVQAQQQLMQNTVKKRYTVNFWLPGSRSQRDQLFMLPKGTIALHDRLTMDFPELSMRPDDRIALTGPNGIGKSTLIRHIMGQLAIQEEHVIYLPQEIDMPTSHQIMQEVRELSHEQLGLLMTVVSCLGSRPERLLESEMPSPGEIRKLLLALGVIHAPHLIIMDEPTNHLDLPAIECLENALDACPCGLLLVSHDMPFLSRLTRTHWQLQRSVSGDVHLSVSSMC